MKCCVSCRKFTRVEVISHTHTHFYTQTVFPHTFYTQMLLHTDAFSHRHVCTQTLLHTSTFTQSCFYTHRCLYTQAPLHTEAFTHRRFYTHMHLHTHTLLHTDAFTHRRYYTQTLLHTNAFTHRRFYAQALLHTDTFTHKRIYTNKCRIMLGNPLRDLARRSVITYNHTFSLHFYYQNVVLCLGTRFGSGRSIITHFHQISTSMSY